MRRLNSLIAILFVVAGAVAGFLSPELRLEPLDF
jgi:hypothetical protein